MNMEMGNHYGLEMGNARSTVQGSAMESVLGMEKDKTQKTDAILIHEGLLRVADAIIFLGNAMNETMRQYVRSKDQ